MSEVYTARWEYVTDRGLELPNSKIHQRFIPLPMIARFISTDLPRTVGNPFIIEGRGENINITDLQRSWRRIRKLAGLDDLWIQDLRHTYASTAMSSGMPIQIVEELLGHSQLQTTLHYAHLADDPVCTTAQGDSAVISTSIQSKKRPTKPHLRLD